MFLPQAVLLTTCNEPIGIIQTTKRFKGNELIHPSVFSDNDLPLKSSVIGIILYGATLERIFVSK